MSWQIRRHPTYDDLVVIPKAILRRCLDLQFRSQLQAEKKILTEFDFRRLRVLDFGGGDQNFSERNSCVHYESVDPEGAATWKFLDQVPRDRKFDLIVCGEVLEHLSNPAETLKALACFQNPGQKIFVTTPFLARQHGAPNDFQRWTAQGLQELLEKSGYEVNQMVRRGNLVSVLSSLLNYKLYRLLTSPLFLGGWFLSPVALILLFAAHMTLRCEEDGDTYLGLSVLATKGSSTDL